MLHAGGLCDTQSGAAIVYVAPGGTGKTTVSRTLGPGRGYISDETVAVGADGTIVSYPKPLSVRRGVGGIKDETAPGSMGLESPPARPWLAGIVVLRRDLPWGEPVQVSQVGLLDALVMLAPETSSLTRMMSPLRRLGDVIEMGGGLRVVRYNEAAQLEPVIADVLRRSG